MIDHIIIGAPALEMGINYVFDKTNFRAALGGQHRQWNTENALLSLGDDIYLEIISPQPCLVASPPFETLSELRFPRTLTWAAKTEDIQGTADGLNRLQLRHGGVMEGTRVKKDGSKLNWKILFPENNFGGVFPFFIQWDKNSIHPASTAPKGLKLHRLMLFHPEADLILNLFGALNLDQSCNYSTEIGLELIVEDDLSKYNL